MSESTPTVLVVDDEPAMREVLETRLEGWGYRVLLAADAESARALVLRDLPDLVLSDVVLPGLTGIELLSALKSGDPSRPVVLITAHGSVDTAVEAMKLGASDFLTKPLDPERLQRTLAAALDERERLREVHRLESTLAETAGLGPLVGVSPAMQEVHRMVRAVAASDASILVSGESGTGKELVARAVHDLSPRRSGPFVAINAAAIPEGLTESELFGHERGAFTGATTAREGCFERADGGTLFLDEITEMPVGLQTRLLRVLEEGRLTRVGGSRPIPFSVRVVAATNREPAAAVEGGRLRRDLYYRLNVFHIALPPLRDRGDDVILLAHHFLRVFNDKHGMDVRGFDDGARELLRGFTWPGNVRELRNLVERAVILAGRGWIEPAHLPPDLRRPSSAPGEIVAVPVDATVAEAERLLILDTLERVGHNKAEAARRLGVDVKTIRNKLRQYRRADAEP